MKLRELLPLIEENSVWDKEMVQREREKSVREPDIRPNSVFRVCLCFMSEEETWVYLPACHPMLVPYYDAEVYGVQPGDEKYTLEVWLGDKDWFPTLEVDGNAAD